MRTIFEQKRVLILTSLISLGALIVLSVGLRDIPFRDAQSFEQDQIRDYRHVPLTIITSIMEIPFATQLAMWAIFLLMFVFIGLLLSPEMRKRLIKIAIRTAIIYWALYILFTRYQEMLTQLALNLNPANASDSASGTVPIPEFAPPPSVSWVTYLIASLAIMAVVVFVGWKIYSFWKENHAPSSEQPLKQIAKIARTSINELSSGRNSTDVIMNCYHRMSDVIASKRKIERGDSVTPAEFAIQLQSAGLPSDAVQRLTRLFEGVRYGERRTSPTNVNEAVSCLTAILHHCGESA